MKLQNNLYRITERAVSANQASFTIKLLPENEIYKAHFPGMPITPGVCIVQLVKELFEEVTATAVEISMLKNVKFLSVLQPSDADFEVLLSKINKTDNGWSFQAIVKDEVTVYAKLSVQTVIA